MHSILWASILASAGVAVVTTLLVEYLAKPWLEARKDRILEKDRERREGIKDLQRCLLLIARLRGHADKDADVEIPEEYQSPFWAELSERMVNAYEALDPPESVLLEFAYLMTGIEAYAHRVRHGRSREEVSKDLEPASNIMLLFYESFSTPRWRLRIRRNLEIRILSLSGSFKVGTSEESDRLSN